MYAFQRISCVPEVLKNLSFFLSFFHLNNLTFFRFNSIFLSFFSTQQSFCLSPQLNNLLSQSKKTNSRSSLWTDYPTTVRSQIKISFHSWAEHSHKVRDNLLRQKEILQKRLFFFLLHFSKIDSHHLQSNWSHWIN